MNMSMSMNPNMDMRKMHDTQCCEALKEEIRALNFALLDLKLYLDTHPFESDKMNIYNSFVEKSNCLMTEYQEQYGPLICETCPSNYTWEWNQNPWPWDYNNGRRT